MADVIANILSFVDKQQLIPDDSSIIIGLSGGPDSVFLLHFLRELAPMRNLNLLAAHLDHQWRQDSYKDADFCKVLCDRLGIPLIVQKASQMRMHDLKGRTLEEKGRILRRIFFEQLLQEKNANIIALGHHEQDQQETFFIRLIRGTTLSGLIGMRAKAGHYIRPLLQTSKSDILAYLDLHGIAYLVDPTNVQESMLRNCIRLKALPALNQCDKRFDQNFLRTLQSLQQTEQFLERITEKTLDTISTSVEGTFYVNIKKFFAQELYLQHRLLLLLLIKQNVPFVPSESLLAELIRFLRQEQSAKHELYQTWSIIKQDGNFYIKK